MWELILRPLLQRAGTTLGTFLAGLGASTGEVDTVVSAFLILAGLAFDLVQRRLF